MVRNDEADDFGTILAQLSLKQGLKVWGKRAKASATKEMQQMHTMPAFFPREAESLSREERKKALFALISLKEKRDDSIKSRMCVDGLPQREYIPK